MKKLRWLGGIYLFGPDEEAAINNFIDFFETGGYAEDLIEEFALTIFPILKNIKEEIRKDGDTLPPCMGEKRFIKAG